ncbi:TetR/AcrR family transcriptional regulator [Corynebacterium pseudotuberculosis]|uniref:HTH-type transcriptional repressor AcnR n=1 Tax=Corynebacterium pseudotuberculosis 258 TaxID=1168865 RepID=A0AAU8QCJ0_CORPS|nr:TetR/AcrR family transcriptional regulator [Corynebacterium pseudotuberculosis]AER69129.1 HTH-type transcriptional repressor AcnR [Corynebacterium pseudotuberculosis 1/06-A]AEQ06631.1 TetR family transcriptional regulator [Corynebacterium pseudotuberculosis CIP 52.97]AFB72429.1 TetR family transcriptional regulator [Corynebacterium pseudotuberculosis 316]AFH90903.1 TetR family transcriptional regulator [Corynebacterium pseudotuberculosis 31]AFK16726.1 TetR family transcriptional regulator [
MPVVSSTELTLRRQEILEGARRCFAEHGYEGATVRRLEEAIGKSRGAIFHHFSDKENLFLALAREDAARMAEVVAENGLVEVMRDMLDHPERHDWLATRLEIIKMLRTDPAFRARWQEHQQVLDEAVVTRLERNAHLGRMRDDVPIQVLHTYLETVMDGFISRLASGTATEDLDQVLDLVEETVRSHPKPAL